MFFFGIRRIPFGRSAGGMIRGVIFDVDGTLVDSVDAHAHSWVETMKRFGHFVDYADMRHQIGKGGDQLMREFLSETQIERDGPAIEAARKELFRRDYLPGIRAFPQVRELLERLVNEGRQIVLASSANGDELEAYKEKARIADLVQNQTSKDDVEKSKPHPDIFAAAYESLCGVSKDEVRVIGDTPWDALAAGRAGLRMIGVLCGGFSRQELREAGCLAVVEDPADVLRHYESLGF